MPREGVADPVGVEHRCLRHPAQPVTPVDQQVGVRPGQGQGVAVPAVDPADGVLGLHPAVGAVVAKYRLGAGQVGGQASRHRHRSRSGAAAPVGHRERLVEVHVHDVEAHVAGAGDPKDGVQVGAVVVEQPADLVGGGGDLAISSSNSPRVLGLVSMMPATSSSSTARRASSDTQPRSSLFTVTVSYPPRGHRRRVRAVGRVGDDHLGALAALSLVPGPHEQQPGELTCGPCRRLQGDVGHARHLAQGVAEGDEQLQPTLDERCRCAGVTSARPGRPAASSHSLGLYFMVHEPSG